MPVAPTRRRPCCPVDLLRTCEKAYECILVSKYVQRVASVADISKLFATTIAIRSGLYHNDDAGKTNKITAYPERIIQKAHPNKTSPVARHAFISPACGSAFISRKYNNSAPRIQPTSPSICSHSGIQQQPTFIAAVPPNRLCLDAGHPAIHDPARGSAVPSIMCTS